MQICHLLQACVCSLEDCRHSNELQPYFLKTFSKKEIRKKTIEGHRRSACSMVVQIVSLQVVPEGADICAWLL